MILGKGATFVIVYQKNKAEFLDDAFKRDIEAVILAEFTARTGGRVGQAEIRSWKESLLSVAKTLNDEQIPADSGVAIEYNIPQTGKRIDFMLSGKGADNTDTLIIIELKQWSSVKKTEKDAVVVVRFANGEAEVSHPSYQAWSYASLLNNFNEAVYDGQIRLQPCAYLHNYASDSVLDHPFYSEHIQRAPLFLKGEVERKKLQDFIKRYVKYGDKAAVIYRIDGGRIRPSKSLVDSLSGMLSGNQEFVLIDDQKVVFENALVIAGKAAEKSKQVLIVDGGPGTGKSVVAVNLLVSLTAKRLVAKYVTKNAAPRDVFQSKLTGTMKKTAIANLFTGSGSFTAAKKNEFDVLVVDEAHRLNEKSGLYANLGENQIKELIGAAKCSIFFIDEDQRVTFKDIGRKDEILRWAEQSSAVVTQLKLESQFRCNGSDGYLVWLDNTLQIKNAVNDKLDVSEFDFRVIESPQTLRELIVEKNKANNKARLVAGYCWDWVSKKNPRQFDVVIPDYKFAMQWNLSKDGGLWIMANDSVDQIGCIHTCQGLEVDYIGVVVGPDLVVRNGKLVTLPEKRSKHDKSLSGYKKLLELRPQEARNRADAIIKNTYRTLMTRGMKGCYVYFTDKETAAYFRDRLVDTGRKNEVVSKEMKPRVPEVQPESSVLPFKRLQHREVQPYVNAVPLFDLKIAAGHYSGEQSVLADDTHWVQLPDTFKIGPGIFVAQVVGESMNRRIPNGAWCVFRTNPVGSRQGKVVVAEHRQISDADTGARVTVKVYQSEKVSAEEGEWRHGRIVLKPDSTMSQYRPIVLEPEEAENLKVVAELIAVLG
jgi:DUF2075 family protein